MTPWRFVTRSFLAFTLTAGAATAEQTGAFSKSWPLPSDDEFASEYSALGARHGFKIPDGYPRQIREKSQVKLADGSLPDPDYEVYVPRDYRPGRMFGLVVWINAGERGDVLRESWNKVLDKHHLIWIGPADVGNNRDTLWRTYMAFEAVRQARLHFTIDDERVYVAGLSGGGRIASHAALVGSDMFTGGFYFVGCDFWRDVPVDPKDLRGEFYRGFWRKPDGKLLRKARTNRFVLLTGSDDFNRGNTLAVYAGYKKDEYKHVTLLEVPGLAHTLPEAEWFDKGLTALDAPLTPPAKLYEQATKLLEQKRPGEACLAYGRAAVRAAGQPFVADAVRKSAAIRKEYDAEVARIRELIDAGKLDAANEANAKLKTLYTSLAERQANDFAVEIKAGKQKRSVRRAK